jgi:hypothetical protein
MISDLIKPYYFKGSVKELPKEVINGDIYLCNGKLYIGVNDTYLEEETFVDTLESEVRKIVYSEDNMTVEEIKEKLKRLIDG